MPTLVSFEVGIVLSIATLAGLVCVGLIATGGTRSLFAGVFQRLEALEAGFVTAIYEWRHPRPAPRKDEAADRKDDKTPLRAADSANAAISEEIPAVVEPGEQGDVQAEGKSATIASEGEEERTRGIEL